MYFLDQGYVTKNIYVILYVDDLVIATKDEITTTHFKKFLMKQFDMIALKELNYFLGIRIQRSKFQISLDQITYLKSILRKFNMSEGNPASTPLSVKLSYSELNSDDNYDAPCRNIIFNVCNVMHSSRFMYHSKSAIKINVTKSCGHA